MTVAVGVLAHPPLPGRCKPRLAAGHSPSWVAGFYAAMLRDTLDGLQMIDAADFMVFVDAPADATARETELALLRRHVPAPWEIVTQDAPGRGARAVLALSAMFERGATYALLVASDAPSAPTEPLADAIVAAAAEDAVLVGPSDDGGYVAIGMPRLEQRLFEDLPWATPAVLELTRARGREQHLAWREVPPWYDVDEPSDVLRLVEELRKHPDRAPRTAQFLVSNG